MRKEKQNLKIDIANFDIINASNVMKRHSTLLPNTIRAIICGPSNSGKSNVMLSLLVDPNALRFQNVYVYSKSLYQDKYKFLKQVIDRVPGIKYYEYTDNDMVVDPENAEPNSVFIFDDVSCEKQDKIRNYFCMGRHKDVDSFYLSQTYSKVPKQLIRDNTNMIVLFKQDDMNLKHIYSDHVNTDMPLEKFKHICAECWNEKYGFLVIMKDNDLRDGRYRSQFDTYIIP